MHILEAYALSSGRKIKKPFIVEKFFPLNLDKYIVIQPFSKPSKSYDYWNDVIEEIYPILQQNGYSILQIGAKNEPALKGCYNLAGQTNLGQAAYLIRNCELFLGADSFGAHIASSFGKKIVALYSNNYVECVKPFWSTNENSILLEPETGKKPSFSFEENPKSINKIPSEKIAESVVKLLGIDYESKYETIFTGSLYQNKYIETIPNQVVNTKEIGIESIVVRMDMVYSIDHLVNQLNLCKCSIVTDREIDINLIKAFKDRIKELIFDVKNEKGFSGEYLSRIQELNIPNFLLTSLKGDDLNRVKLEFLDFGNINEKNDLSSVLKELISKYPDKKLFYKSNKITLSEGMIFQSIFGLKNNLPVANMKSEIQEVSLNEDFIAEMENFKILIEK